MALKGWGNGPKYQLIKYVSNVLPADVALLMEASDQKMPLCVVLMVKDKWRIN